MLMRSIVRTGQTSAVEGWDLSFFAKKMPSRPNREGEVCSGEQENESNVTQRMETTKSGRSERNFASDGWSSTMTVPFRLATQRASASTSPLRTPLALSKIVYSLRV